jgi:hypothetical protein
LIIESLRLELFGISFINPDQQNHYQPVIAEANDRQQRLFEGELLHGLLADPEI